MFINELVLEILDIFYSSEFLEESPDQNIKNQFQVKKKEFKMRFTDRLLKIVMLRNFGEKIFVERDLDFYEVSLTNLSSLEIFFKCVYFLYFRELLKTLKKLVIFYNEYLTDSQIKHKTNKYSYVFLELIKRTMKLICDLYDRNRYLIKPKDLQPEGNSSPSKETCDEFVEMCRIYITFMTKLYGIKIQEKILECLMKSTDGHSFIEQFEKVDLKTFINLYNCKFDLITYKILNTKMCLINMLKEPFFEESTLKSIEDEIKEEEEFIKNKLKSLERVNLDNMFLINNYKYLLDDVKNCLINIAKFVESYPHLKFSVLKDNNLEEFSTQNNRRAAKRRKIT